MLVQSIEYYLRVGVFLDVYDYSHTVLVALLVNIGYTLYSLLLYEVCHILYELCLVYLIRNFGNNYSRLAVVVFFYLCLSADYAVTFTRAVSVFDTRAAENVSSRRIVGRGYVFHKVFDVYIGIVEKRNGTVDNLSEVVRRNGRSHTYRNTVTAVDEQVRISRRKYYRLFSGIVEVGIKVYRLFVDISYHFGCDFAKSCLGVSVSCRGVAVHATEVTVTVYESTSDGKVLRKSYQSVVNRAVAVRMVFTEHVTDDKRTLTVGLIGGQTEFVHIEEDSSVYGLKTVSYVGNCTRNVYRHSVRDKRSFHFVFGVYVDDVGFVEHFKNIIFLFFHSSPLIRPSL